MKKLSNTELKIKLNTYKFNSLKNSDLVVFFGWPFINLENIKHINDKAINIINKLSRITLNLLRKALFKYSYFVEGYSSNFLRKFGFLEYGPIITVTSNKDFDSFFNEFPKNIENYFNLKSNGFIYKNFYFPDTNIFINKIKEYKIIKNKFNNFIPYIYNFKSFCFSYKYKINKLKNIIKFIFYEKNNNLSISTSNQLSRGKSQRKRKFIITFLEC